MNWAFLLAQLPNLMKLGVDLFEYVQTIRTAAQQAGEWTPEMETQFQTMLTAVKLQPQWQPDPK